MIPSVTVTRVARAARGRRARPPGAALGRSGARANRMQLPLAFLESLVDQRTSARGGLGGLVSDYLPIVVLFVLGVLFAGLSFLASGLLVPRKRPTAAKLAPYECGIVPDRELPQRFPVRFYLSR